MSVFLILMFLFFLGSVFGYAIELIWRRIHYKKWINPGFLVGPYLPIYGFGLCSLSLIYFLLDKYNFNPFIEILLMGIILTLIELVGGLIFIKGAGVKLWDYSSNFGNYKGIICPRFTFYWTLLGAFYYYFLAEKVTKALVWYSNNLSFSFVLGMFFSVFILDFIYSSRVLFYIRNYARDNDLVIKYEKLKNEIKDEQDRVKSKYSFVFPFKQTNPLRSYLDAYNKHNKNKKKNIKTLFRR